MEIMDRLDGESRSEHEGRVIYLEMGAGRSYTKVARKLDKDRRTVTRWGSRHDWKTLAIEYDSAIAAIRHGALVEAHREDARATAGMVEIIDEADLRRLAFDKIAARAGEMLDCLIDLATGGTDKPRVQLGALRHALALIGLQPVQQVRTELSGSLSHHHSQEDSLTDAQLHELLSSLDTEELHALDHALSGPAAANCLEDGTSAAGQGNDLSPPLH